MDTYNLPGTKKQCDRHTLKAMDKLTQSGRYSFNGEDIYMNYFSVTFPYLVRKEDELTFRKFYRTSIQNLKLELYSPTLTIKNKRPGGGSC